MGEQITAHEAAGRLGIDVRTLYAYVSRGSLHRSGADGNRRSLYDADEVELLARRGRPRSTGRSRAGIDVVVGSSISAIGDGWIRYRGIDPVALVADGWTFERVAGLLWYDSADIIDGTDWTVPRETVRAIGRTLAGFGPDANLLDRMTAAVAVASGSLDARAVTDLDGPAAARLGRTLIAALVESLPEVSTPASRITTAPPNATIAARLWPRLSPLRATPARIGALDRAMVLLAEHELATSTLAVRIATSVRAPLTSVLMCGIATLSGSAHAGAATLVHDRLRRDEVTSRNGGTQPRDVSPPPGFGHPVHVAGDPRAEPLLAAVDAIASGRVRQTISVTRAAGERVAPPNSDFALGALCYAGKMRPGAAEAIFAAARSAGWIAHAAEESAERPVRYRARAVPRTGAAAPPLGAPSSVDATPAVGNRGTPSPTGNPGHPSPAGNPGRPSPTGNPGRLARSAGRR
jgi:citrate synthase